MCGDFMVDKVLLLVSILGTLGVLSGIKAFNGINSVDFEKHDE